MNTTKQSILLASVAALASFCAAPALAQNLIQNPDFTTDTSGYETTGSAGSAGYYDPADPDRAGSSALNFVYGVSGGDTGYNGLPAGVTTVGQFVADSYDAPVPDGGFTSNTENVNMSSFSAGTARLASKSGDIFSFYQNVTTVGNTPVVFAPFRTYTLSAYSTANSSGNGAFANTGVGLSGNTALTYDGIVNNPSHVSLGLVADPTTLTLHTVSITILPMENSDLIGQQIVANLIDEASITGGGRVAAFTDVTLTVTAATPEPSTYALLFGGLGFVAWVARRRLASAL